MAQKYWTWYSNTGGSLSNGSLWYLTNGSTPGSAQGVPGASDAAQLLNNGATGAQTLTGNLGVQFLDMEAGSDSNGANFILAAGGSITTGTFNAYGTLVVKGSLVQNDVTQAINLYGGKLTVNGGSLTAEGVYEGVMSGGTFQAIGGSTVTFLGAPNSITTGGLVGLTVKGSNDLIDNSQVNSTAGLFSIGTSGPGSTALLTVQNNSHVQTLYTFIGSLAGIAGSLVITGAGTTYADVGVSTTNTSAGNTFVGAYNSTVTPTALGPTATLAVTNGATLTDAKSGFIGNEQFAAGAVTVSTGGIWTVSQALRVGQFGSGTLLVSSGGTVRSSGPHVLGTSSISFGNNAGSVGKGTVAGTGATLDTGGDRLTLGNLGSGTLNISSGGKVTSGAAYADSEAALSIAGSAGSSGTLTIDGAGSLFQANGLAVIGGNSLGSGSNAGGAATVSIMNGARLNATSLALFAGGTITVDPTAIVDIGGTAGAVGALTVEAGSNFTAYGGTVGTTLTGAGTVTLAGAVIVGNITGGTTFQFGVADASLKVIGESGTSTVTNFAHGASIDFAGQTAVTFSGNTLRAGSAVFNVSSPGPTHVKLASDGNGGTVITATSPPTNDLNGDGDSDVVLQNSNGSTVVYTMNGGSIVGGTSLGSFGPGTQIVGTGDFNGDGTSDTLIEGPGGSLTVFTVVNNAYTAGYSLGSYGSVWNVAGTGDFNGDGKSDILLQDTAGDVVGFTMNGGSVTAGTSYGSFGTSKVVGIGDFNGDGTSDMLIQGTDGTLTEFTVKNNGFTAGFTIGKFANLVVAGVGDYNGDGKSDILLQSTVDNSATIFDMNGGTVTAGFSLGTLGNTKVVASGDYNGDGTSDIVTQAANGALTLFTMTNNGVTAGFTLGNPGLSWHLIDPTLPGVLPGVSHAAPPPGFITTSSAAAPDTSLSTADDALAAAIQSNATAAPPDPAIPPAATATPDPAPAASAFPSTMDPTLTAAPTDPFAILHGA